MDLKEFDRIINQTVGLIRRGYSRGMIISEMLEDIDIFSRKKIFEIAKCRITAKKKFGEMSSKLFFDEDGLRYSTPPDIARYRARRLKCESIADVSCGVGIQAIFFAMESERVIAIDKDPIKIKLAHFNAGVFGVDNIDFLCGDATDKKIASRVRTDIVFSDPSRKPEEPVRTLETLNPPPTVIRDLYSKITDKIAFELPPQISRENITLNGEKEYTSLDFMLNRLALYTGSLQTCDISAISLPSEERITDKDNRVMLRKSDVPLNYIYEVNPTITKSSLLSNLAGKIGFDGHLLIESKRRTLLTSEYVYNSAFLRRYTVQALCGFDIPEIKNTLRNLDAGKVTLRMEIDPKKYWNMRKAIEENLSGKKKFVLFKIGNTALITEKDF